MSGARAAQHCKTVSELQEHLHGPRALFGDNTGKEVLYEDAGADHGGIDVIAIGRAVVNDIRTMSLAEGGSTITQQVAKNLFFTQEKRFERKVAEVFMAFDLEAMFDKREILELYVNSSYFGDGYTGIGQASWGYLGHAPAEMTDEECALMAGLPNAPSWFAADPEAAQARQRIVVQQMEKYGYDSGTAAALLSAG